MIRNSFRHAAPSYKRRPGESFKAWSNRLAYRAKYCTKLIWNSSLKGNYIRDKHGEIGSWKSQ